MRAFLLGLACLAMAACVENEDGAPMSAASNGGYTLEIRATEGEQIYMVTGPDGRVVAGRAAGGASALMEADAIRALAPPVESELPEVMAFSMPGFSLNIGGQENGGSDAARISINAGGREINIDAHDNGTAGSDRAQVRITGVDANAARDFIAEADELSPAVQAQMLAGLGLE